MLLSRAHVILSAHKDAQDLLILTVWNVWCMLPGITQRKCVSVMMTGGDLTVYSISENVLLPAQIHAKPM